MNTISTWKQFEISAQKYLKKNYGYYADFERLGGEDSTLPDILVSTKQEKFYIEAKSSEAQSGQFVIFPDFENCIFNFSEKNKTEENELTKIIVDYMNNNWSKYKDVSTKGLNLDIKDSIFANWITNYYKSKKVKYFISGSEDNFIIIPIDDFSKSFEVTATYRKKRSGTNPLSKKYLLPVTNYFKELYESSFIVKIDKHFYVNIDNEDNNLDKTFFEIKNIDKTFYLSKDGVYPDGYRISTRSKTVNPNIIFSIKLKSGVLGIDHDTFISQLIM